MPAESHHRHHTIRWTPVPGDHEPDRHLFVMHLLVPDAEPVAFLPLVRYFVEMADDRSIAWQRIVAAAVGCFVDYVVTVGQAPLEQPLLQSFAIALRKGTRHHQPGVATGDLDWAPRSFRQAHRLLTAVLDFLDWASADLGVPLPENRAHDTTYDRLRRARAAERRRAASLLGHLGAHRQGPPRAVVPNREHSTVPEAVHAFDESRFADLCNAFKKRNGEPQWRDVLITLLLHGGGLRTCEPFHLFKEDVRISPDNPRCAEVRLYHPESGAVASSASQTRRGQPDARLAHLRGEAGMSSRNRCGGRFHAGWKKLRLSHAHQGYTVVRWSSPFWGEVFLDLFYRYMAERPEARGGHPFLFVSEHPEHRGEPYTIQAYRQAHAQAVRDIGLVPRKDLGTTPHAHRHAFGKRMREAGLDRLSLQSALNHCSPGAQDVYGLKTAQEVAEAFLLAAKNMSEAAIANDLVVPVVAVGHARFGRVK